MKVLLADDHPLFRDALKRTIELSIDQAEVFDADSVAALYSLLEQHSDADLLLLDLHMPGAKGFSALIHIRASQPGLPVIVISGNEDPAIMQRAIGHGASAYIPKNTAPETMSSAIGAVLDGEVWLPNGVDEKTTSIAQEEADIARRIKELTPHQFRVLMMLADGSLAPPKPSACRCSRSASSRSRDRRSPERRLQAAWRAGLRASSAFQWW